MGGGHLAGKADDSGRSAVRVELVQEGQDIGAERGRPQGSIVRTVVPCPDDAAIPRMLMKSARQVGFGGGQRRGIEADPARGRHPLTVRGAGDRGADPKINAVRSL